jgi:hypothetical protein
MGVFGNRSSMERILYAVFFHYNCKGQEVPSPFYTEGLTNLSWFYSLTFNSVLRIFNSSKSEFLSNIVNKGPVNAVRCEQPTNTYCLNTVFGHVASEIGTRSYRSDPQERRL